MYMSNRRPEAYSMSDWTRFSDLRSGGTMKTPWSVIFIEGSERVAANAFDMLFGFGPLYSSFESCGFDYSFETLFGGVERYSDEFDESRTDVLIITNRDLDDVADGILAVNDLYPGDWEGWVP